jgi:hypothetical protein
MPVTEEKKDEARDRAEQERQETPEEATPVLSLGQPGVDESQRSPSHVPAALNFRDLNMTVNKTPMLRKTGFHLSIPNLAAVLIRLLRNRIPVRVWLAARSF